MTERRDGGKVAQQYRPSGAAVHFNIHHNPAHVATLEGDPSTVRQRQVTRSVKRTFS